MVSQSAEVTAILRLKKFRGEPRLCGRPLGTPRHHAEVPQAWALRPRSWSYANRGRSPCGPAPLSSLLGRAARSGAKPPSCGRACRVLFGSPFRCRMCHGLRYNSQYESWAGRAMGRVQSLRARLGGSANLLEPFPPRPKHMQSRTYARLRALDLELLRRCTLGLARDLESLRRRSAPR